MHTSKNAELHEARKGQRFGKLKIIEYVGNSSYKCECDCGNYTVSKYYSLRVGRVKSCGKCNGKLPYKDISKQTFGKLTALEYLGQGMWKCSCECGAEITVDGRQLRSGNTTSCGCSRNKPKKDLTGQRFVNWEVLGYAGDAKWLCRCDCGTEREVLGNSLRSGRSTGCGCQNSTSKYEREIREIVSSLGVDTVCNSRKIISPNELDIYVPEKELAIEFNGNYWHSTMNKLKRYHQSKTLQCAMRNIRLIHIFEYEWVDSDTNRKLKDLLKYSITSPERQVAARKCKIAEIEDADYSEFLNKYHLQNSAKAPIRIGCYYENELLGVMSFGAPRFNGDFEYELIRLCWKPGVAVVGGLERMFKQFCRKYNPESIITYVDISKFTGTEYLKIGFLPMRDRVSEPDYKWVKNDDSSVLSRYQTQKHKLVEQGLGTELETEDEIMEKLGYFKVYDSGNLRLAWYREEY